MIIIILWMCMYAEKRERETNYNGTLMFNKIVTNLKLNKL